MVTARLLPSSASGLASVPEWRRDAGAVGPRGQTKAESAALSSGGAWRVDLSVRSRAIKVDLDEMLRHMSACVTTPTTWRASVEPGRLHTTINCSARGGAA